MNALCYWQSKLYCTSCMFIFYIIPRYFVCTIYYFVCCFYLYHACYAVPRGGKPEHLASNFSEYWQKSRILIAEIAWDYKLCLNFNSGEAENHTFYGVMVYPQFFMGMLPEGLAASLLCLYLVSLCQQGEISGKFSVNFPSITSRLESLCILLMEHA